jgi:hypothetical protein
MSYSVDQLSTMMDALTARVAALDGVGLNDPSQGFTTTITRRVRGLETTLKQYVLTIQSQFTDVRSAIASAQAALNTLTQNYPSP